MSIRYLGSKARVVDAIMEHIGSPGSEDGFFVDAFSGTGTVAREAAARGWQVVVNDNLLSAALTAGAGLLGRDGVPFCELGGYETAVGHLNSLEPVEGFIHATYSPSSLSTAGIERRYFTEDNAGKIDAVRAEIRRLATEGLVSEREEALLLADLLGACNRVANTAGTYGCFLRKWSPGAVRPLEIQPRSLPEQGFDFQVMSLDVGAVPLSEPDVLYLDPPYTKRQYAAYYHILETVAHGDAPAVEGVTGLRPWKDKASDFCYKSRAHSALVGLISRAAAARVHLSYSSEGHVDLGRLVDDLSRLGEVTVTWLADIGRYRPNRGAVDGGDTVSEYLISIDKSKPALGMCHGEC